MRVASLTLKYRKRIPCGRRFPVEEVLFFGGPAAVTPKRALLAAFNAYCEKTGRPPMMDRAFGRALKRLRPEVGEAHRILGGAKKTVWIGVGLREGACETQQQGHQGSFLSLTGYGTEPWAEEAGRG
jgi:hypothetical protein